MRILPSIALISALAISLAPVAAHADTLNWTTWSYPAANTPPDYTAPGTATGVMNVRGTPVTVTYSGQLINVSGSTIWLPTTTFDGGASPAPPDADLEVAMTGGQAYSETITFSSAVTNPIMAIWSLGQGGILAQFNFTAAEPFSIISGGPSQQYGGSSITQVGNSVYASEGNGDIEFAGTYTSLTFTTPVYEDYYAFTVGSAVPEPSSIALLGTGLLSVAGFARRKLLRS